VNDSPASIVGVYALAVSGSDLYVGGLFTTAGGNSATNVAKWDGSAWSALGSGVAGTGVNALAVLGSDLYVGGSFTLAGGSSAKYVAKWNGSGWSALGSGMDGVVWALAVSGSDLYVGGEFTRAGTTPAYRVAKWSGSAWSALGSGVNGTLPLNVRVSALALSGSDLYVGGSFTSAGGNGATNVAKWNGSAWSALGSGVNATATVWAMSVLGSNLYVGGTFTNAGGTAASRIAKWDGSAWSALGSGVNSTVRALAVSGSDLYVGGSFTTAGGKVSGYVARAYIGAAHGIFTNWVYSPATGFSCTFSDGTSGQPYRIQASPSLVTGPWTDLTNFIYAAPLVITDASAVSTTTTCYRAVTP
jgi:hypothetical protein